MTRKLWGELDAEGKVQTCKKGNLCTEAEKLKENFNGPSADNCLQVRIKNEKDGGNMAPFILKFELGLRSVVRFTSQPLNVRKKGVLGTQ
jgi:hypothetical protein